MNQDLSTKNWHDDYETIQQENYNKNHVWVVLHNGQIFVFDTFVSMTETCKLLNIRDKGEVCLILSVHNTKKK
jgi:hypothetical protein